MERVYYSINEEAARLAKSMMSFNEYKEGSKTEEYKALVDATYDIADEVAAERPDEAEKVYGLAQKYSKQMADVINRDSEIGTRCPSVMICGPGNFPVKKKEKQVEAWRRNHEEFEKVQGIRDRIRTIGRGGEAIMSGDSDAVTKLEKKIAETKALQEKMRESNKALRMKDREKCDARLKELGYSDEQIEKLHEPDFCGRIGYPQYKLQNNNQNIHRLEGRLKTIKEAKETGNTEEENEFCKVIENTEIMRIQLVFDGKPDSETRDVLKRHGFRWAPSQTAWQRTLNSHGRWAAKSVIDDLEKMKCGTD